MSGSSRSLMPRYTWLVRYERIWFKSLHIISNVDIFAMQDEQTDGQPTGRKNILIMKIHKYRNQMDKKEHIKQYEGSFLQGCFWILSIILSSQSSRSTSLTGVSTSTRYLVASLVTDTKWSIYGMYTLLYSTLQNKRSAQIWAAHFSEHNYHPFM